MHLLIIVMCIIGIVEVLGDVSTPAINPILQVVVIVGLVLVAIASFVLGVLENRE